MKLKNLFVVPEGQKISEKSLYRVLIANVCSILLCLACLAGSTWAWFTVSLENTDNVIQMGYPQANVYMNGTECYSGITLEGQNELVLMHDNPADSLNNRHDLYVTFMVNYAEKIYDNYTVHLEGANFEPLRVKVDAKVSCTLSWSVSWFAPANATMLSTGEILVPSEAIRAELEKQESSKETTTTPTTETTTAPTTQTTTVPTTQPPTDSTTETTTDPTAETTESIPETTTVPTTETE